MLEQQLQRIEQEAISALDEVDEAETLEIWRVAHLGRSSPLMGVFDQLGQLPKEERPAIGRRANQVKRSLEAIHDEKGEFLKQAELHRSLETEQLDVTLPGRKVPTGRLHPITLSLRKI